MASCTTCGKRIESGARFCPWCGSPTPDNVSTHNHARREIWEGAVRKCPYCGEPLESFSGRCPACGNELRDLTPSNAVRELDERIRTASSEDERARIIRSFPVPNSREDLLEFLTLASSTISNLHAGQELDAWRSKYEQCYQKAQITLGNSEDLAKLEKLRQDAAKKMQLEEIERGKRRSLQTIMHPLVLIVAILLIVHEIVWLAGGNGFGLMNIIFDALVLWVAIKASIKLESRRK